MQYGTFPYRVWDIYIYNTVCDILQCSMGHLYIQYGTSIYTVWDIYVAVEV